MSAALRGVLPGAINAAENHARLVAAKPGAVGQSGEAFDLVAAHEIGDHRRRDEIQRLFADRAAQNPRAGAQRP